MNCQVDEFQTQLKIFYGEEKYSDAVIEIMEVDDQLNDEGEVVCSLPVHRIILATQCEYFKNLFDADMEESKTGKITIKVNQGNVVYVKLFIQLLYDYKVIQTLSPYDLLRLLILADQYCCNIVIQTIIDTLPLVKIKTFDECKDICSTVGRKNFGLDIVRNAIDKFLYECALCMINKVFPLEKNIQIASEFCETLPFSLLLAMLSCKKPLAWHENTILYFVNIWFKFDVSRQNADDIDLIFSEIDHTDLTPEFVLAFMINNEIVYESWPKFKKWCNFTVATLAISPRNENSNNLKISRNDNEAKICKFRMVKSESGMFLTEEPPFLFKGCELLPKLCLTGRPDSFFPISVHIDIGNLEILFEEYHNAVIAFSVAAAITSEESHTFKNITKGSIYDIQFKYDKKYFIEENFNTIGFITKSLLKNASSVYLLLAFKDSDGLWPNEIADKLLNFKSNQFPSLY